MQLSRVATALGMAAKRTSIPKYNPIALLAYKCKIIKLGSWQWVESHRSEQSVRNRVMNEERE